LLACTSLSKQKPQSEKKKKKSIEKEKVANLLVRVVKEESVACLLMSLVEPSIAKSVLPKPEGASERREPREKSEREGNPERRAREKGGRGDSMTHNWSFKCFQDFLFLPTK
jgi:hypothetical protein